MARNEQVLAMLLKIALNNVLLPTRFTVVLTIIKWQREMVHVDWLSSGLEKVILPSQEIHLAC